MAPEEGDVVCSRLDSEHEAELVVHLDGGRPHVVFDASSLEAGAEVIADIVAVVSIELAPEERRDRLRLDGMDDHAGGGSVDSCQVTLAVEDHVRRVLSLHDAPVIARL